MSQFAKRPNTCLPVPASGIKHTSEGWLLVATGEIIPFGADVIRFSPDGKFYVCRRPDRSIRYFYIPDAGI